MSFKKKETLSNLLYMANISLSRNCKEKTLHTNMPYQYRCKVKEEITREIRKYFQKMKMKTQRTKTSGI